MKDIIEKLSQEFSLSETDRRKLLPSGTQRVFNNRVGWAKSYLKHAMLVGSPQRGTIRITQRGIQMLGKNPSKIDIKFLERYPEFVEFRRTKGRDKKSKEDEYIWSAEKTPQEILEDAYQKLQEEVAQGLLDKVKSCSPEFFERLVIDLLVKMGYGGSHQDVVRAFGGSGDEGIDGIIKEDKLGLDVVYVQAKRWQGTVGRPEIHKFVGALSGKKATKGVFITTSSFSKEALDYVQTIQYKVILIDGETLSQLMYDYDIGLSKIINYDVKEIDTDYFAEE